MKPQVRHLDARLSVLALALLSAFASHAQVAPAVEGSASVGLGLISGDRQDRSLFNQYNGLRPGSNAVGLFGADYYRRDDERGTTVQFGASDLLNGNRELGLRWKRQGDWKFSAEYGEGVRYDPHVANTGLIGAGNRFPTVVALPGGPGTGGDVDLKLKRSNLGFSFSKVLSRQWQFDASVQTEKKEGSRLFGIGFNCPSFIAPGCGPTTGTEVGWATLMLPEPVNANHTQAEARVTFGADKLNVSVGYYGSFYRNSFGSMTPNVPGRLYNPLGVITPLSAGLQGILGQPVALPPDNQAHQLDLLGSYAFNPTTQLNFKLGYSRATQHDNFAAAGLTGAPAGVSDLGGKMSTALAQVGFTARPMPKLSVTGQVRYEHRDDDTPLALYNLEGTSTYTNRQLPLTRARGKVQAAYQFTPEYRGAIGIDANSIDRGEFTPSSAIAGVTALRQKTDETGVRAELRKRMSEDFSGAVSVESSRRTGSNWLRDNSGLGVTEVTDPTAASSGFAAGIFSPTLMDRHRNKVKIHADWQPLEALSLQASAEVGRDRFDSPSGYGVRRAGMNQVSLDWAYELNPRWNLNGFVSRGSQDLDQARPGAAILAFDNTSTTLGVGFTGKPMANLEVGGNLAYTDDKSEYAQTLDSTAGLGSAALLAATGGLPDITFRQLTLKLFGKYTLDKQSAVRVDLIHQRSRWNDWAWDFNGTPFVFSDGTTVNRKPRQSVVFLGVSYIRRWP
jgi:MtrB/PioB family decaheme-associated outer membrane protein